jgi:hypothetical protein
MFKKLILTLLFFMNSVIGNAEEIGKDKYLHLGAGILIASTSKILGSDDLTAIAITSAIAVAKEASDKKFDGYDAIATILGGVVGIVISDVVINANTENIQISYNYKF